MAGPKPKPTALKLLEGNRGHQKLNRYEPQPRPISPDKPDFFGDTRASDHWDRLLPVLEGMGVLTEADADVLKLLCLELSVVDRCSEGLRDVSALVYETSNKSEAPRGLLKLRRDSAKAAESLMARLGLSPADRTKIEVKKADDGPSKFQRVLAKSQ